MPEPIVKHDEISSVSVQFGISGQGRFFNYQLDIDGKSKSLPFNGQPVRDFYRDLGLFSKEDGATRFDAARTAYWKNFMNEFTDELGIKFTGNRQEIRDKVNGFVAAIVSAENSFATSLDAKGIAEMFGENLHRAIGNRVRGQSGITRGDDVMLFQLLYNAMIREGYFEGKDGMKLVKELKVDGAYGDKTANAIFNVKQLIGGTYFTEDRKELKSKWTEYTLNSLDWDHLLIELGVKANSDFGFVKGMIPAKRTYETRKPEEPEKPAEKPSEVISDVSVIPNFNEKTFQYNFKTGEGTNTLNISRTKVNALLDDIVIYSQDNDSERFRIARTHYWTNYWSNEPNGVASNFHITLSGSSKDVIQKISDNVDQLVDAEMSYLTSLTTKTGLKDLLRLFGREEKPILEEKTARGATEALREIEGKKPKAEAPKPSVAPRAPVSAEDEKIEELFRAGKEANARAAGIMEGQNAKAMETFRSVYTEIFGKNYTGKTDEDSLFNARTEMFRALYPYLSDAGIRLFDINGGLMEKNAAVRSLAKDPSDILKFAVEGSPLNYVLGAYQKAKAAGQLEKVDTSLEDAYFLVFGVGNELDQSLTPRQRCDEAKKILLAISSSTYMFAEEFKSYYGIDREQTFYSKEGPSDKMQSLAGAVSLNSQALTYSEIKHALDRYRQKHPEKYIP